MKGWTLEYVQSLPPEVYGVVVEWVKDVNEAMRKAAAGEDPDEPVIDMDSDEGQALKS